MAKSLFAALLALSTWVGVPPSEKKPSCTPAAQCCKICEAGQACGNSCISRQKTCHKGRGCACDAVNVCPAE